MTAIMYGTGNAHFDEWVDDLATTTLPQGKSRLVTIKQETGKPEGYCCMGHACTLVPGLGLQVFEEDTSDWDSIPDSTVYDEIGHFGTFSEMAPPELLIHLGIEHDDTESDIFVDLPEAYWPSQGPKGYRLDDGTAIAINPDTVEPRLGCSTLNDRFDLTFSQIADVLRYFGIMDTVLVA